MNAMTNVFRAFLQATCLPDCYITMSINI